jgi:hypothetical protein
VLYTTDQMADSDILLKTTEMILRDSSVVESTIHVFETPDVR